MDAIKNKQDTDFEKLCEHTIADLRKYILYLTNGDIHTADEILQKTYLLAKEKQDKLLSHPNPAGWLSVTAQNLCRQHRSFEKKDADNTIPMLPFG